MKRTAKTFAIATAVAATAAPSALALRPAAEYAGQVGGTQQPVVAPAATGTGFDWADAGIGAGSAVGLFLLMGAGVAVTQRKRPIPA